MPSKTLVCKDCKKEFNHDEREQTLFTEKGWGAPIRCVPCRRVAKQARTMKGVEKRGEGE